MYVTCRLRALDFGKKAPGRIVHLKAKHWPDKLTTLGSFRTLYSPRLSFIFQCHLNIELCVSRVSGIEYHFKYVCKGNDRKSVWIVRGQPHYNEIGKFQDARYVSAFEALWRLSIQNNWQTPCCPVTGCTVHLDISRTITPFTSLKSESFNLQTDLSPKLCWWVSLLRIERGLAPFTKNTQTFRLMSLERKTLSLVTSCQIPTSTEPTTKKRTSLWIYKKRKGFHW